MEGKVWRPGPTVCRCCLSEGCYKDISTEYFWMGKKEVYADMLSDTFNLSIQYAPTGGPNSQSRLICEPCISRLRDATDFRRQIKECEQTFMEYLNPSTTVDIEIPAELPEKEVKIVTVKVEKPLSDDDDFGDTELLDDDDDDLDDEPLMNLASKVPKKESVDVTDLIDNAKAEKRKSTTKVKATPKKAKVKEAKPSVSKAKPEKKKKAAENASNETEILERLNAATLIEHTTIKPFLYQPPNFKCFYCFQTFPDISSLLQHDSHSIPRRPLLIKNHLKRNIKADISELKCRICGERFADLSDIRLHLDEVHKKLFYNADNGVITYDLTLKDGLLECHKCKKILHSFFLLNKHMNEHSNVVCETCGLGFVSKQRLRCHMTVHQNGVYKCGNCDAVLPTKFALRYHYLSRHAVEKKRFKCALCFERFSEHYTKMKHLKEIHGILFNFTCSMCKENFHTRKAFWKHKNKMHNQTIKCEICGKCFGENWVLKMHLKSHTGDKPYGCDICQKSYKQKKSLLKHKTVHET